ncbi:MAG: recombinase family protein [Anaerorhabdus sp.]|uniref:recombinase family protein n=1 Tax=Anaerorhabdus sp. TaxID=1872524 RepID=UPI003A88F4DE
MSIIQQFKNAIGYIRVSTDEQATDDKFGIEVQKKEILIYANNNGYNVVDWRIDTISGAKDNRPEMDKILYGEDITNPPYQAVIVFKNDRVARDTKLYFYYFYTLEKRNIKLLSTEEDFSEGNDFANIYRSLLMFVAEQERKNIALRTTKGRNMKAACGGYSGGRTPYGYNVNNGILVVDSQEKEIVRFIFDNHNKGISMLAITESLAEHGYKTRKGRGFQVSTIKSILSNKLLYQGMYRYGKDMDWVQGVHEAILEV